MSPQFQLQPPLKDWLRPIWKSLRTEWNTTHGPLIALKLSQGSGGWDLDDRVRMVVGALQDMNPKDRDLWAQAGQYTVVRRVHLGAIVETLSEVGELGRLTVREFPGP